MNIFLLRPMVILVGIVAIFSCVAAGHHGRSVHLEPLEPNVSAVHPVAFRAQIDPLDFGDLMKSPLTPADLDKADGLVGSVSASEWLGPLAPIAISPFFGVTILAGMAQFGGDWMPANEFISNNAILKNPAVFWVFLALTILTSVPRFTKVSKPAAQAVDQLEAYAGIITIILLRVMMMTADDSMTAEQPIVMQAGFLSFSADTLMCIAAVINIMVINTVKFFFEVSVWLMPFPFVDAMLGSGEQVSLCSADGCLRLQPCGCHNFKFDYFQRVFDCVPLDLQTHALLANHADRSSAGDRMAGVRDSEEKTVDRVCKKSHWPVCSQDPSNH